MRRLMLLAVPLTLALLLVSCGPSWDYHGEGSNTATKAVDGCEGTGDLEVEFKGNSGVVLTVTILDGQGKSIHVQQYRPTGTDEPATTQNTLTGAPGKWVATGVTSNNWQGAYKVSLSC